MRLSRKLLTALLPIAATGAIVPAVTSCNKGNGYVINFGDEINCLDEKGKNYHSLDEVKNTIKSRISVEQKITIGLDKLPKWTTGTTLERQMMYFDLIASLSIMEGYKFHLTFDEKAAENNFTLVYLKNDQQLTVQGQIIEYQIHAVEDMKIAMTLKATTGDSVRCYSYAYKNSWIA